MSNYLVTVLINFLSLSLPTEVRCQEYLFSTLSPVCLHFLPKVCRTSFPLFFGRNCISTRDSLATYTCQSFHPSVMTSLSNTIRLDFSERCAWIKSNFLDETMHCFHPMFLITLPCSALSPPLSLFPSLHSLIRLSVGSSVVTKTYPGRRKPPWV